MTTLPGPIVALEKTGRTRLAHGEHGVRFSCRPHEILQIKAEMAGYLKSLGLSEEMASCSHERDQAALVCRLNTPGRDGSTLDLAERPGLGISTEQVRLRFAAGDVRIVGTVSQKEIVLALLHPGRLTDLRGADCSVDVLSRHVSLRQNIVAWAEKLEWRWPDGGPASWNHAYWDRGTPKLGVTLGDAIDDVFANPSAYTVGCYTATKLVMVKGIHDFYSRAHDLPGMSRRIHARLLSDREPLLDVEPAIAWSFESDFDPKDAQKPGKILTIVDGVAPRNFVPGDWVYFLNTDRVSSQKTGYEGSNAIYLGGGRFVDYYGENNHAFTYTEKVDEVFQWRHGVFDPKRDSALRRPLTEGDIDRLSLPPERGGLLLGWRITPEFFGAETQRSAAAEARNARRPPASKQDPVVGMGEAILLTER